MHHIDHPALTSWKVLVLLLLLTIINLLTAAAAAAAFVIGVLASTSRLQSF